MFFKKIIENGWPCKKASVEIQDPTNDLEVLERLRMRMPPTNLLVEMVPKRHQLDLVVRERYTGAVLCHLASC